MRKPQRLAGNTTDGKSHDIADLFISLKSNRLPTDPHIQACVFHRSITANTHLSSSDGCWGKLRESCAFFRFYMPQKRKHLFFIGILHCLIPSLFNTNAYRIRQRPAKSKYARLPEILLFFILCSGHDLLPVASAQARCCTPFYMCKKPGSAYVFTTLAGSCMPLSDFLCISSLKY